MQREDLRTSNAPSAVGGIGMPPETKYAYGPDGAIGYQVFGSGRIDLVFVTQWATNIDTYWDEPSAARYFDRLASFSRVIVFDKRGTGVSDPISTDSPPTVEEWANDVAVVMAAANSERAVLVGDCEGGLMAISFAAAHPEKVEKLVLVNSRARALRAPDYPVGMPDDVADRSRDAWISGHGVHAGVLAVTAPSVADDARFVRWWLKFQRSTMPPAMVAAGFDWQLHIDVRDEAEMISVPTLVVHGTDNFYHRIGYGRWLAENIPGARMVEVAGRDSLPFHAGDFDAILDEVEMFVTGETQLATPDRKLVTVLFTDIVASTEQASELGDQRWLDLLREVNRTTEAQVKRFGGTSIHTTGDGHLSIFDVPAQAVSAAKQILHEVGTLGVALRAGIHTGEISQTKTDIAGIGVHIASRVLGHAPDGGIAVSSTVRDLTVGSPTTYDPLGSFELKGVPGEWSLYEVG
ncbi:MAG: alpha/beta fold hydrolase [Acidimicrobiia bacterium]